MPAPPEAITGIETARDTAAVSSQSKPLRVPSRSIDVSRISPAPRVGGLAGPLDGIAPGGARAAAGVDGEAVRPGRGRAALGVDGDDDRLAAVADREARDQVGILQRRAVQADLVGAGVDDRRGVVLGADAAADRERDEQVARHLADRVAPARAASRASP